MSQATQQEEGNGQEREKEEAAARNKKVLKKIEKIKLKRCFRSCRRQSSAGFDMASVYELKLRRLRMNNQALAKALADKKIEAQEWYREIIDQKMELQEVQERLLRATDKDFEVAVEYEVEKRLREHCEPISAAISTAMDNVVVVVESLTKVKQLVSGALNTCRNRSSSNNLPRTSGSRLPLGPIGNNLLPRQSVVLPMVSGHVLQPAMVAIPKLDVMWNRKLKERIQVNEERDFDMSVIGELPSNVEDEEIPSAKEEVQSEDEVEEESPVSFPVFNIAMRCDQGNSPFAKKPRKRPRRRISVPEVDVPEPQSITPDNPRKANGARRGRSSRGVRGAHNRLTKLSPTTSRAESPRSSQRQEEHMKQEIRASAAGQPSPENVEDPLEGPSWWYGDASKGRGRGVRRGRLKTGAGSTKYQSHCNIVPVLESSSDGEDDDINTVTKKTVKSTVKVTTVKANSTAGKELKSAVQSAKVLPVIANSPNAQDQSYLASPATQQTMLEELQAKGGGRSKARSKGFSVRMSIDTTNINKVIPQKQGRRSRNSMEILRDTVEDVNVEKTEKSPNLQLEEIVIDPDTRSEIKSPYKDSLLMPPPCLPLPNQHRDFLITDNDLTCVNDVSMDMTEPITKIIAHTATEMVNKEEKNKGRRFFKAQSKEEPQDKSEVAEKTPFDVSLMETTLINIPPYSSQRTVEKENFPPQFDNCNNGKDSPNKTMGLRRVSIVVEDILKNPGILEKYTPKVNVALSSESEKSESGSGRVRRNRLCQRSTMDSPGRREPIRRKTLRYSVKDEQEEQMKIEEDEEEDVLWLPYGLKKNKAKKGTGSSGMAQAKKSVAGRKRFSAVDSVPQLLKRSRQKKNKRDSEAGIFPENSDSDQDENHDNEVGQEENGQLISDVAKDKQSQNTSPNKLSDCFVHMRDIRQSVGILEDSLTFQLDDSRISLSPIGPQNCFKHKEDLSKQIESVLKKAHQMRMERTYTSENADKREENADGTYNGGQTVQEEKNNEIQQYNKDDGRQKDKLKEEVKDKLQKGEKDKLQKGEEDKLQEEEKDKLQEEERDKLQEGKEDKLQEGEKEELQQEERDKLQEGERDKLQEEDKGKLQEKEKDKLQEEEKYKLQDEEKNKLQQDERDELEQEKLQDVLQEQIDDIQQLVPLDEGQLKHQDHETQQISQDDTQKPEKDGETCGDVQSGSPTTDSEDMLNGKEQQLGQDKAQERHTEGESITVVAATELEKGKEEENIESDIKKNGSEKVTTLERDSTEDICNKAPAMQAKLEASKVIEENNSPGEPDQRRKRRAATKITSLKEVGLREKLRQSDGSAVIVYSSRKSRSRSTYK
ncbi:titin homolog isoform X1 [Homarus americanus]|uniref:titin homolog isoform X1 n=1 Tax=Homarus americanus TaxID=6706 RepID=UPI001C448F0C|nr:titin homolog isoform X1 [Homarus americanus]XP_042221299.1 titin homolog isoform X1 [Homarus americanus]